MLTLTLPLVNLRRSSLVCSINYVTVETRSEVQYDALLTGAASLLAPHRTATYQSDSMDTVTIIHVGAYPPLQVKLSHHQLFPLQYSITWDLGYTYAVLGGNDHERFYDLALDCECGGELDNSGAAPYCAACLRDFLPLPLPTLLTGDTVSQRNQWVTATLRSGGCDELEATLRTSILTDLFRHLDACNEARYET